MDFCTTKHNKLMTIIDRQTFAEEKSLEQGESRVKFKTTWKGTYDDILKTDEAKKVFTSLATKLAGKVVKSSLTEW